MRVLLSVLGGVFSALSSAASQGDSAARDRIVGRRAADTAVAVRFTAAADRRRAAGDGTVGVIPVVLTISGGISLGSYQSGVNWGLIQFFKRATLDSAYRARYHLPKFELVALAGASAGNINAILSAIQ